MSNQQRNKKAMFCYGIPIKDDDKETFKQNCKTNINIMSKIAKAKNYEFEVIPFSELYNGDVSKLDLFYFTGHGNNFCISDCSNTLDTLFDNLNKNKSQKIIILDACTGKYLQEKTFPENLKVIGGEKIYDSVSLAKLLYDAILCRDKEFRDLTEHTFKDMSINYSWVKVEN